MKAVHLAHISLCLALAAVTYLSCPINESQMPASGVYRTAAHLTVKEHYLESRGQQRRATPYRNHFGPDRYWA
jgi:hypothetical protein